MGKNLSMKKILDIAPLVVQKFSVAGDTLLFKTHGEQIVRGQTKLRGQSSLQEVLNLSLVTSFSRRPGDLLRGLVTREGQSFEGVTGHYYHEEDDEGLIPQGKVCVWFKDDDFVLPITVFKEICLCYFKAHFDADLDPEFPLIFPSLLSEMDELEKNGMKIPSLFRKKFQATIRVDVFDHFTEKKTGQDDIKIGEAYSDGQGGLINVLDSRFTEDLRALHRVSVCSGTRWRKRFRGS